jgi:hypothetical protein
LRAFGFLKEKKMEWRRATGARDWGGRTEANGVKEKVVSGKNSFASGLAPEKKRSLRKDDAAGMCFSFSPFFLLCKFPSVVRSLNLPLLSLPLELGLENNHAGGEWS